MQSLLAKLTDLFSDAFEAAGLERSFGEVTISQRPDLGQFQCNGALPAAKQMKQNPRAVAESVLAALKEREVFADLSLAGPGFINISLTGEYLARWTNDIAADPRLGIPSVITPTKVVIDFGGPNVAKAMHVGHLRSSIIGDSLQRIFRFRGDDVVSDVHLGDWGTQMGMLITELRRREPGLPYFDPASTAPYPEESPVSIDDLERLYPQASARCKEDAEAMEEARIATMELQQGRPGYRALWRHFVNISVAALKRDFASLGVTFDLWLGESDAQERIPEMIARLERGGFVEESKGAKVIYVPPVEEDEKEIPPLILVKSDGGVMYGTTDMATLDQRVRDLAADLILYVVDGRQSLHFEQVFRAARRTGLAGEAKLEHIAFGTVNGPDGKPFKTRAGGVMKLSDLIQMATEQAGLRMKEAGIAEEYSQEERDGIARMVGIAAVKYADLMNHRTTDYIFDLEKFTRFEGRTGAYLLYAAVRCKSILRKAEERGFAPGPIVAGERERELQLMLAQLPDAIAMACEKRAPNYLCEYIYNLAQVFSRFYSQCHILTESDPALRASWLGLTQLCLNQFTLALGLLGIEVPERM